MSLRTCIGREPSGAAISVEFGERIESVSAWTGEAPAQWLSPGWVDIQVNGYAGADYCSPHTTLEDATHSVEVLWSTGVTRFFPTVITGSREGMAGAIANLAKLKAAMPLHGKSMVGFHIEGPHISPVEGPRGAHPESAVRPPDIDELKSWIDLSHGQIKLVTVAPEWPGAASYIEFAASRGIVIAIGHTMADSAQIAATVSAGATMSTHLGNGAHATIRRHPNYIWDQLADDRLAASFIADGIHLPAAFLKVALRAKGVERSVMTTDAVMPAGCRPGRYRLGEVDVELHDDDRVTLVGKDKLAGSSLRMDRGVENLMRLGEVSFGQAIAMSSRNPARCGRIEGRCQGLAPGELGDLLELDFDAAAISVRVRSVYLEGENVYRADRADSN